MVQQVIDDAEDVRVIAEHQVASLAPDIDGETLRAERL